MSEERLPFFVYGTLRAGEPNWEWALSHRTEETFLAVLPDYNMYAPPGARFPAIASVEDGEEGTGVIGEIVFVYGEDYDDAASDLDHLEGWNPSDPDRSLYHKVVRDIEYIDEYGNEASMKAWVYEMGPRMKRQWAYPEFVVESGDWLAHQETESDEHSVMALSHARVPAQRQGRMCGLPAISKGGAPCSRRLMNGVCPDHGR